MSPSSPSAVDFEHDRLNLYELMDHVVSLKWLVVLGVIAGLAIGTAGYLAQPPITTRTEVVFYIYTGGTPDYAPAVVGDQLRTKLTTAGLHVTSGRGSLPIVVFITASNQLNLLPSVVADLEKLVDSHIDDRLGQLRQWTRDKVPDALGQYLRYQSYHDGRADNVIDLINFRIVTTDSQQLSLSSQVIPPAIVGFFGSLALCLVLFLVQNWRRHR